MDALAERWLAEQPPEELWSFLSGTFDELLARHPRIVRREDSPAKADAAGLVFVGRRPGYRVLSIMALWSLPCRCMCTK